MEYKIIIRKLQITFYYSLDAASIHRRRRSTEELDHYDVVINGFGESYRMTLQHTTSVLHPSAKILTIDDDVETKWQGQHPNCFLTGDVHSHNGSVSASFCSELVQSIQILDILFVTIKNILIKIMPITM